jgi:hypothetical protein
MGIVPRSQEQYGPGTLTLSYLSRDRNCHGVAGFGRTRDHDGAMMSFSHEEMPERRYRDALCRPNGSFCRVCTGQGLWRLNLLVWYERIGFRHVVIPTLVVNQNATPLNAWIPRVDHTAAVDVLTQKNATHGTSCI